MRRLVVLVAALALCAGVASVAAAHPADAAPVTTADWADGDNTSSAWSICMWVGARDLGTQHVTLERARNIDWFGDAWVGCDYQIRRPVGSFIDRSCQHALVDRDRSHLLSGTYWLAPTEWSVHNSCRH
jgi:hypothetical protein